MQNEALNDNESGDSVKSTEVMEKLGAYVDGELSSTERDAIEALLERDKTCREVVQSFRFLDEAARRETVPSVNAEEWARIWEAIEMRKGLPATTESASAAASPRGTIVSGWFYRLAAAAAVITLAFVGFRMMQPPATPEHEIVRPQPQPETRSPGAVSPDAISPDAISPDDMLDIGEPDEDGEVGLGLAPHELESRRNLIDVIGGDAPDEISEDGVKYHDF